jgi:YD repeat-containing protein
MKSYTLRNESVTDALGNTTIYEKDAHGNLVSVKESLAGRILVTTYTYDSLGKPTVLIDTLGNTRSWSYDGYGRLERAEDLHSP